MGLMLPRFIDQSPWAVARHLLIKTTYWPRTGEKLSEEGTEVVGIPPSPSNMRERNSSVLTQETILCRNTSSHLSIDKDLTSGGG